MNRLSYSFNRLKSLNHHLQNLIRKKLWVKVLIGMVLGIITGFFLSPSVAIVPAKTADIITHWLALPGNLFLSLVKMIIIPLIVASIIIGITANRDTEQIKKMGLYIVIYFLSTTAIAISIGVLITYIIKPGKYIVLDNLEVVESLASSKKPDTTFSFHEIPEKIVKLIPENPLNAMVSEELLSIVIFTIIVGIALLSVKKETAAPIIKVLASLQEVCITIVKWAMMLVPFAVFGLMTRLSATTGLSTLKGLAIYIITVLAGLLCLLLLYVVIIRFLGKKNPLVFFKKVKNVQLLAFSTSSSAAVMPASIKVAEDELGVKPSISQFIIPIGATINMDGSALYQGVATIFLAQIYGVDLGVGSLLLLIVTIVVASIGAPSAPGIGIVVLASILESVGIPAAGIALIISVDRILDMSRTAVNVTGDLTASVVFNKWFGK